MSIPSEFNSVGTHETCSRRRCADGGADGALRPRRGRAECPSPDRFPLKEKKPLPLTSPRIRGQNQETVRKNRKGGVSLRRECPPSKLEQARERRKNLTPTETRLWFRVRCSKLGFKIRRQVVIRGYIVDFYAPKKRLIIELDGKSHELPGAADYDARRTEQFEKLGFRVIRFTNDLVWKDLPGVLDQIKGTAP